MKAKTWVIKRQETFDMTYVIETEEEITEDEAKDLLFMDGLSAAEEFDKSWVSDEPMEGWETLPVPEGKTFGIRFDHDAFKLVLLDED